MGLRRRISSTDTRCETSSEYTRASRTRRAISCEYCPPRSTTSTGRSSVVCSGGGKAATCAGMAGSVEPTPATNLSALAPTVIGRVLRDRDVVRVRLAQARAGDADEARLLQGLDRR